MTPQEYKHLKKIANTMRKVLKQIDECGEWNTTQESYSLRELYELATEMKTMAWEIYDRGFQ